MLSLSSSERLKIARSALLRSGDLVLESVSCCKDDSIYCFEACVLSSNVNHSTLFITLTLVQRAQSKREAGQENKGHQ
jgi:hypothetical protein